MLLYLRNIPSGAAAAAAAATIFFFRRGARSSSHLCRSTKSSSISVLSSSSSAGNVVMDERRSKSLVVLCGKSSREDQFANALLSKKEILNFFGDGEEQEEVKVFLRSEVDLADYLTFVAESYMDALRTDCFGRLLIWTPRIPSTHDVVSKNFNDLPVGAVCITDVQYKGRGRVNNVWESPHGCLMFSFTLQMEEGRKVPLLQYVISLAITEAIKECCQTKRLPQLDVRIKWPNDLYLNGLKVGGILCTSTYSSKKFNISAGIGLNLDNDKPTTCINVALQAMTSVSCQLGREDILAAFFNNFEKLFEVFLNQGFQALEELYYRTWLHSGQQVVIEEKQEGLVKNTPVTIQGLTSSGYLLAVDEEHRTYELHPDGNSLDFFNGLVKRRLE